MVELGEHARYPMGAPVGVHSPLNLVVVGGGYSGGVVVGTSSTGVAGGGGSYNNGKNQLNMARVNKGRGNVFIKFKL